MGWLGSLLVFPDDVWEEAARKLGRDSVKGRWLANSEIKFLHREHPITLEVRFGTGDDSTQYTKAIPGASLPSSNHTASGNRGRAVRFQFQRSCRAVPEQPRDSTSKRLSEKPKCTQHDTYLYP
jgi:hypothetical protein